VLTALLAMGTARRDKNQEDSPPMAKYLMAQPQEVTD
jgi:hypothetical protein